MTTTFLESYDVFSNLAQWKEAGSARQARHWTISLYESKFVRCSLTWKIDGQMASLDKTNKSGPAAVWMALEEFEQWEQLYKQEGR